LEFGCYHLFNQSIELIPAGLTLQSRIDAAKQDLPFRWGSKFNQPDDTLSSGVIH
jgi:hypothetical protein